MTPECNVLSRAGGRVSLLAFVAADPPSVPNTTFDVASSASSRFQLRHGPSPKPKKGFESSQTARKRVKHSWILWTGFLSKCFYLPWCRMLCHVFWGLSSVLFPLFISLSPCRCCVVLLPKRVPSCLLCCFLVSSLRFLNFGFERGKHEPMFLKGALWHHLGSISSHPHFWPTIVKSLWWWFDSDICIIQDLLYIYLWFIKSWCPTCIWISHFFHLRLYQWYSHVYRVAICLLDLWCNMRS